ncbi:flavodoxin FldB [Gilvimarinus sp. SDUM040013]|uniref:Flavodoxin n=1 Tax=Gilvimarinus gilvus TaxID=3058038 RepID=A0ABU4RS73_9GAMM|nr:flavodoxin FldB [Gilvimarinus sp. SDUM040013]MDO3388187.1 flavodoxin FldB [Gilvimarinus sp. SDUM040013]MDX6847737.1 flavodoxin FldB [Gilvimarinus sp. SDUM040013]
MKRAPIALFYGSSTCYTEMAGEKIRQILGEAKVDVFNIADTPIVEAEFYDCVILGIPTWDYGELQEDWDEIWDDLDHINWQGKKVALYGLGDQIGYPEWFLDAMGYLHAKVVKLGAIACGYWPNQGYDFETSKALINDDQQFVGLALDDENEFDLSEQRITTWCAQITHEFGL